MDQQKIGRHLAEKRKEKSLTQAQLAELLGVSDRSVSRWENGATMPDVSLFVPLCTALEMTLDELDAAREWMLLLGRKTAREKIASLLAILARRSGAMRPGGQAEIDLPLSREAMADYLGLTLETVSRQMTALKRDGIIVLDGARRVSIPDCAALIAESGSDAAETALAS